MEWFVWLWILACLLILVSNFRTVRSQKAGFCMLLTNDFPTQFIWDQYLKQNPECRLVIHGKKDLKIDPACTEIHRRAFVIPDPIETSWGSLNLVKAQNICIRKLLEDEKIHRIFTVSGNCIPLRSEKDLLQRTNENESIFTEFNVPDRLESVKDNVTSVCKIDKDAFKLHSQWCVLTREHARILVNKEDEYARCFENVGSGVSDETVYLTTLRQHGCKNIKIVPCLKNNDDDVHGTTFCHWKNISYKFKGEGDSSIPENSPKMYKDISLDELNHIRNGEYLFARKFSDDTKVQGSSRLCEYLNKGEK